MFFDMRNHFLYGLESIHASAMDEQVAMCMAFRAYDEGCRFIMATPSHGSILKKLEDPGKEGLPEIVRKRFDNLTRKISWHAPGMEFGLGCELHCNVDNVDELIHHLKKGHLPTLNGTRYVLVVFPADISRKDLWECLDRLDGAGYLPVIGSVQNINTLKHDIHEILCLKGQAQRDQKHRFRCLIQLDTLALHFFERENAWAKELIRSGVVDLLGTNALNTYTHPPLIQEVLKDLPPVEDGYRKAITWGNAAALFRKG